MLSAALKKRHLLGEAQSRRTNSRVNQLMQTASTIARYSLSVGAPFSSSPWIDGRVLIVSPIVEATTKRMEIIATT